MITLSREEAQQMLDALTRANQFIFLKAPLPFPPELNDTSEAIKTLRARLAEKEQLSAADNYAHRLALMLECMLLSPDKTWNAANNLVGEYHEAVRKEHEAAGEPYVSGFGKD